MNVLMVASEAVPFAKTGGLADVVGSLPKALKDKILLEIKEIGDLTDSQIADIIEFHESPENAELFINKFNSINAKYDAELAALDSQTATESEITYQEDNPFGITDASLPDNMEFSPESYRPLKENEKQSLKEDMEILLNELENTLERKPTLLESMRAIKKVLGNAKTDQMFNYFIEGLELVQGKFSPDEVSKVYNNLFKTVESILQERANVFETLSKEEAANEKVAEDIESKTQKPKETNTDTNRRVVYRGLKTVSGSLKAAYLHLAYKVKNLIDGKIEETSLEDSDSQTLVESNLIDPTLILTSKIKPGTKLKVRPLEGTDLEGVNITVWEGVTIGEDGVSVISETGNLIANKKSVPFLEWQETNPKYLPDGSLNPVWVNNVPMVAYYDDGGTQKGAFLVHSNSWYNSANIGLIESADNPAKTQLETITEGRRNVVELRKNAIENKVAEIEVTDKEVGKISFISNEISMQLPTINSQWQGSPDQVVYGLVGNNGILYIDGRPSNEHPKFKNAEFLSGFSDKKRAVPGTLVQILPTNKENTFAEVYTFSPSLESSIVSSIEGVIQAIIDEDTNMLENIKKETGLDVANKRKDLETFFKFFIRNQSEGDRVLSVGDFFFNYNPSENAIFFGRKGIESNKLYLSDTKEKNTTRLKALVEGLNSGELDRMSQNSSTPMNRETRTNTKAKFNVESDFLGSNQRVVTIENGQVIPQGNYKDFISKHLRTNIRTFNIGTEANPNYSTFIQPSVFFEQSSKIGKPKEDLMADPAQQPVEQKVSEETQQGLEDQFGTVETEIANELIPGFAEEMQKMNEVEQAIAKDIQALENQIESTTDAVIKEQLKDEHQNKQVKLEEVQENKKELLTFTEQILEEKSYENLAYSFLSPDMVEQIMTSIDSIEGLSVAEEYMIINHISEMFSETMSQQETIESKKHFNQVLADVTKYFTELRKNKQAQIENWTSLMENDGKTNLQIYINDRRANVDKIDTVLNNIDELTSRGYEYFKKYTKVSEITESYLHEGLNLQETNHSKTFTQEDAKKGSSYFLKRFYKGQKQFLPTGKPMVGFLGLPVYVGFDTVDDVVKTLLTTPIETEASFDTMISNLESFSKTFHWLPDFIAKLKAAPQQIKNTFVSENHRHNMKPKTPQFGTKNGNVWFKVFETNSAEVKRQIREKWLRNSLSLDSGLIVFNRDTLDYMVNPIVAQRLYDKYKNISKVTSRETLIEFLSEFGIDFNTAALTDLLTEKVNHFTVSPSSIGFFGQLLYYLKHTGKQEGLLTIGENNENHPFSEMGGVLNNAIKIEQRYEKFVAPTSFRDGTKSIYGKPLTNQATDTTVSLKTDASYREKLLLDPFSKESLYLNLLANSEKFRDMFGISYLGNTAIKELGKKYNREMDIQSLSPIDKELLSLIAFMDTKQGELSGIVPGFEKSRVSHFLFPTISDKSQMLMLQSIALEINQDHFNSDLSFGSSLRDMIFSQMIQPELNRIKHFLIDRKGESTIVNQESLVGLFLNFPELNELKISSYDNLTVAELLNAKRGDKDFDAYINNLFAETELNPFLTEFRDKAVTLVEMNLTKAANNKVNYWNRTGLIDGIPNKYKSSRNFKDLGTDASNTLMALDFIINSQIAKNNMFQLYAGDYTQYGKMKFFNDAYGAMPATEFAYHKLSESVSDAITKRLAAQLAPRKKGEGFASGQYFQIFLNDFKDISSELIEVAKFYYNKEEVSELGKLIDSYKLTQETKQKKAILDQINSDFPMISGFTDLAVTDAQEYTTAKEHVNILMSMGLLEDSVYESIMTKLNKQYEAERKGEPISQDSILSYAELKTVFQPMKPVYNGRIFDEQNGIMREMYIKSSSFPLLPQMTNDFQLNTLRLQMQELETRTGKGVRASYQTANKVGAAKNALNLFDSNGNVNNVTQTDLESSSIVLDRNNFGIQQDVPAKFLTGKDEVSLGTQLMKLLYGDGVVDILGRDSLNNYNNTFVNYVNLKKEVLFERLGLDKFGNIQDVEKTASKLIDELLIEAKKRDYPQFTLNALKLKFNATINSNGQQTVVDFNQSDLEFIKGLTENTTENKEKFENIISHISFEDFLSNKETLRIQNFSFALPLWNTPDAYRFESLLNSIMDNNIINTKFPGTSFVVGSEAGLTLRVKSETELINTSKIIYTSNYKGQLGANDIMLPLRLRDNTGNLIEFFYEDGTHNETYVELTAEGYRLKENMISEELLNSISFRIPTSGLVSVSSVNIVAILPVEMGDLMIVPKNLTAQKGLDFDVDKESMYFLHHYIGADNKVKVLEQIELTQEEQQDTLDYFNLVSEQYFKQLKTQRIKDRALREIDAEIETLEELGFSAFEEVLKKKKKLESELSKMNVDQLRAEYMEAKIAKNLIENKKYQLKALENQIIRQHKDVINNEGIQSKIKKTLSMDFARNQANLINNLISQNKDWSAFSITDDTLQKNKIDSGATGKMGISIYSNAVTLQSLLQQVESGKSVVINTLKGLQIGGRTSTGNLSAVETFSGFRSKAEVFAERQNTATDNANEGIMGAVNINKYTINVDILMTMLGFDQETVTTIDGQTSKISVPYFFLSQPILRDYVMLMQESDSITKPFTPEKKQNILDSLKEKYSLPEGVSLKDINVEGHLSAQNLYNQIALGNTELAQEVNNISQRLILNTFIKLEEATKELVQLTSRLNINSTGVGMDFFETSDKYEYLTEVFGEEETISNASELVGDMDFYNVRDVDNDFIQSKLDEGFYMFHSVEREMYKFIKPKTPVGAMLVGAIHGAYHSYKNFFIYDAPIMKNITGRILNELSTEEISSSKKVDLRRNIFKEFKKYLATAHSLKLFNENRTASQIRYKLLIDDASQGKQSLATYLEILKNSKDESIKSLFDNSLLKSLTFHKNESGFSTIRYNNSKMENFDETLLYNSMIDIMDRKISLPDFNGESYSVLKLVEDLILYTYSSNPIQEATEFVKYIPVSILEAIGFSQGTNYAHLFFSNPKNTAMETADFFIQQYIQHHPEQLQSKIDYNPEDIQTLKSKLGKVVHQGKGTFLETLYKFEYDLGDENKTKPNYVSIYDPKKKKGENKFNLYQLQKDGSYIRIPVLGLGSIAEYTYKQLGTSLINGRAVTLQEGPAKKQSNKNTESTSKPTVQSNAQFYPYKLADLSVKTALELIVSDTTVDSHIAELAQFILNNNLLQQTKIEFSNDDSFRGGYVAATDTIFLSHKFLNRERGNNDKEIAKVFIKEAVHAMTTKEIRKYFNRYQLQPTSDLPAHMSSLFMVFNEARKQILGQPEMQARYKEMVKNLQEKKGIPFEDVDTIYGLTDLAEFVEVIMTSPDFQNMLNIEYKNSNKTFLTKFFEAIQKIFKHLTQGTIATEAIQNTLAIVEVQAQKEVTFSENSLLDALNEAANLENDINSETFQNPYKDETVDQSPEILIDSKITEQLNKINNNISKLGINELSLNEFNSLTQQEQNKLIECYG